MKNPKQHAALLAKRERQRVEGAVAMKEYLANEDATRRRTRRLREARLAREAAEQEDNSTQNNSTP